MSTSTIAPPARTTHSLPVTSSTCVWSQGEVLIGHSADRRNELSSVLQGLLQEGEISNKQAESLRGRMHWFESFAFGRVANQAVKILGEIALRNSKNCKLNPRDIKAIRFPHDRVLHAPPLKITPTSLLSFVLFTDGACEGIQTKVGSVGGVLVDSCGRFRAFFGAKVPDRIMREFNRMSENPIYELELLPVWISFLL